MAKQPTIETLLVGYSEKHKLNKNFEAIATKFDEMLSRDTTTDTPNFMETDLDVADANITNTNLLVVEVLTIVSTNFTKFSDYYIYLLGKLDCDTPGSIITHDVNGDPECRHPGTNGQVLKTVGGTVQWAEDTDTDTVGVTIQEDGVTVAENVTTIDFKWTNAIYPNIVTTPSSDQVDIALDDVYTASFSAIWEDTTQADTNINPDGPSASVFSNAAEVVRLDLVNTVGISIPTTDNEYYFIMESSSWLESSVESPAGTANAQGTWGHAVRFYDNTGTSTALTGNQINAPAGEVSSRGTTTVGGALQTVYCGIPAGTRYVDVSKADAWLFPLFITHGVVDNRYRAVVSAAAKNAGFLSPNSIAYPGGVNTRVTPNPSP